MRFDDKPFIAIWEMTQACDLACKHCRAEARPGRDREELSTDEAKKMLRSFADEKVPLVVFTGGDPAKRPDLVELVGYGVGLGLTMGLTPSVTPLLTTELLKQLRDAGLSRLAVSLDGLSPSVHDGFRGRPGSFARTIDILCEARKLGLSTQVNTTQHEGVLGRGQQLASLMSRLDISLWSVFVPVPTGRASTALLPSADDVESSLKELLTISKTAPFAIKTTAAPHYRRLALQERKTTGTDIVIGARGRQAMWVNEGRGLMFVSHRGQVFPSGFLPMACGSVREKNALEIYRNHSTFKLLRDSSALQGKCGSCEYRNVCGGARARAYAMTGSPMGSDPLCPYVPPSYDGPLDVFQGDRARKHLTVIAGG